MMYIVTITDGAKVLKSYSCRFVEFCVGYIKISGSILVINQDTRDLEGLPIQLKEVCIPTNIALIEKFERKA